MRELISDDADVDIIDRYEKTLLYRTATTGHSEVVKELIRAGVDVNANRHIGMVPFLQIVAALGHTDTVKVLIAAGADVNAKDGSSMTPLYRGARKGHTETVQVLISAGAE